MEIPSNSSWQGRPGVSSKPLASLCMRVHNGEAWVAEALQAAFAQDYSPLEIVIYDDCSTDGSSALIRSMIDDYRRRNGKHDCVFVRGKHNLGAAKAAEAVFSLARGELLIQNDCDDISLPCRVSRTMEAWLAADRKPMVIHCGGWRFRRCGGDRTPLPRCDALHPLGAAAAYSPQIFKSFAPISVPNTYDDGPWAFRALLMGPELVLNDRLLLYRIGNGASTGLSVADRIKSIERSVAGWRQSLIDLDEHSHMVDSERRNEYRVFIEGEIKNWLRERDFIGGRTFYVRWRSRPDYMTAHGFVRLLRSAISGRVGAIFVLAAGVAHLLPLRIGVPIADAISRTLFNRRYR